ncbi:MAG: penicillin-binding protein [Oscillospiraceae bacterium]|jgi:penicillin-binding protein 2|nr:penicillin-binding protein [Oscillospiraceae bacterium]
MNNPFDHTHIQEERAEREARRLKLRTNLLIALFCAVLVGFFAALYQAQVVNGANYRSSINYTIVQTEQVNSVRGDILDRYGRTLVTNEISYNVELDTDAMGDNRNAILRQLLDICRAQGVTWTDGLPITQSAPWTFTTDTPYAYQTQNGDGESVTRLTALGSLAQECKWVDSAEKAKLTSGELLAKMCETFGLIEAGEAPTQADREMAGVLYELYLRLYEINNNNYVFARGVDITFISLVKENALDGVRIQTVTSRRYETNYAAHVLGYTGAITQSTKERYQELGYPMNATVGVAGVELAFEESLHGVSGTRVMELDNNGNIVSQQWQKEPEPGDNAVLTLDIALQSTTEDLLAQYAAAQEESGPMAAAVVDMTGGVLALASYPTFDLSTFRENFDALVADENEPLNNRATQGLYAPGSTFKMLTAVAALSEGKITTTERIECTGIYRHFSDVNSQPHCWIWDSVRGVHGLDDVTRAITDSCNIFFYEAGLRTGIANLRKYAQQFGLGEYTGIEISEYKGWVAGPETSAHFNQQWYDGSTMSASIGQENNQFTPLQLANYVATLVNGGNHYACHLLKEFKSSDYSQVTQVYEPELLHTIDIGEKELDAVLQGMYNLSETASMSRYFSSLPVKVGCKTGTAQVATKTANAVFVCYAPYDDPQVALCLVAEQGASGGNLAELAAGILAQYFSTDSSLNTVTGENTLLR